MTFSCLPDKVDRESGNNSFTIVFGLDQGVIFFCTSELWELVEGTEVGVPVAPAVLDFSYKRMGLLKTL